MNMPLRSRGLLARLLALAAWVGTLVGADNSAAAHEFTAALLAYGPDAEVRLVDAVNGFLLAADERDGHANETSDGHLGGVDVQILPLLRGDVTRVRGLIGSPSDRPDVVVLLNPAVDSAAARALWPDAIVLRAGTLPPRTVWTDRTRPDGFAAGYLAAFGTAPTPAAAQGYNEARRLDLAIRPLDGLRPRQDIEEALAETAGGIDW